MSFGSPALRERKRNWKSDKWTNNREPRETKPQRNGLNAIGPKGVFWAFNKLIWEEYWRKLEVEVGFERRCEKCDGTAYCGILTPAHSIRRNRIRVDDWFHALRVARLGDACHFDTDTSDNAEAIIEEIIAARHKRLGITEDDWKRMLLEIATDIQAVDALKGEKARFQTFVVSF